MTSEMDYASFSDHQGVLGGYDDDLSVPARKRKCKECGQMGHTKRTCSVHGNNTTGGPTTDEYSLSNPVDLSSPSLSFTSPHVYDNVPQSHPAPSSSMNNIVLSAHPAPSSMRRRRQPPVEDNPLRYIGCHTPVLHKRPRIGAKQEESRRRCVVCKKRVPYACKECEIALCFALSTHEISCWEKYHTPPGHAAIAATTTPSLPATIHQPQTSMILATSAPLIVSRDDSRPTIASAPVTTNSTATAQL